MDLQLKDSPASISKRSGQEYSHPVLSDILQRPKDRLLISNVSDEPTDAIEKASYCLDYEGLNDLQKIVLLQQVKDIKSSNNNKQWAWATFNRSQTLALLKSAAGLLLRIFVLILASPSAAFTQSDVPFRLAVYHIVLHVGLFVTNVHFLLAHVIHSLSCLPYFMKNNARTSTLAGWLNAPLFASPVRSMYSARSTFEGKSPPLLLQSREYNNESLRKRFDFSVDAGKSVLMMCAAVYERDRSWIKDAIAGWIMPRESAEIIPRLLKSEEPMHRLADQWGLQFLSIADYGTLGGPFAGVFYDYENVERNRNFIVLVIRGTSFDMLTEWLLHMACNLGSSSGAVSAGMTHESFFNALFPCNASRKLTTPYMRMIQTLKLIASKAREQTGKQTNLWIGGHALGAGIASYIYARLLETPEELGEDLVLRDANVFGSVRDCDVYPIVIGQEFRRSVPSSREIWNVVNRAQSSRIRDQLSSFDTKEAYLELAYQELCADTVMGVRIDLKPFQGPLFYSTDGTQVTLHNDNADEAVQTSKRFFFDIGMKILAVSSPTLHDLVPTSYLRSLCKLQTQFDQYNDTVSTPPPRWQRDQLPRYVSPDRVEAKLQSVGSNIPDSKSRAQTTGTSESEFEASTDEE